MDMKKLSAGIRSLFHPRFKILAYHGVVKTAPDLYEVSATAFKQQMQIIAEMGFTVVELEQAVEMIHKGSIAEKIIVITFDDAHTSIFENAAPILWEYKLPATVFAPTGLVGKKDNFSDEFPNKKRIMSWQQLKELGKIKITTGSHTVHHYNLNKLNDADLAQEINYSYNALQENIEYRANFLAYPFGLLNAKVRQAVSASPFEGALCFGSVLSNWEETDIYQLKREKVLSITDADTFKRLINPDNDLIRGLKAYTAKTIKQQMPNE